MSFVTTALDALPSDIEDRFNCLLQLLIDLSQEADELLNVAALALLRSYYSDLLTPSFNQKVSECIHALDFEKAEVYMSKIKSDKSISKEVRRERLETHYSKERACAELITSLRKMEQKGLL